MEKDKEREEAKKQAKKIEVKLGDKLMQNFSSFFSKTPTLIKNQSEVIKSTPENLKYKDRAKSVSQVGQDTKKDSFAEVTAFSTTVPPKDTNQEEAKYSTKTDKIDQEATPSTLNINTIFNKSANK